MTSPARTDAKPGPQPPARAGVSPWYKDAIVYELSVRAFFDADGDGAGDLAGLTGRLDYLQGLGVTALWLQPFQPSPLRDGGYDVSDYRGVHPDYGTLDDFRLFLDEAHRRELRVITELVLNHTSDQHPWFQRARRAPAGSAEREFYVWSDRPHGYAEARVLFKDTEPSNWTWDPVAGAYYWHRFYAHEPDLNFDHPAVREEMMAALDHWLELGLDGVRLDAVPFLFEREGTDCEDLPETHAFLRELRRRVDERFPGRVLLTEANLWPEDAAAYFGDGDEAHVVFHTPLMPRLFTALHLEDRHPIVDLLAQTPEVPPDAQWALFLRNHDELTLEMVTDEERELMYRAYAADPDARLRQGIRRRLAPLLGNDRRRIELLYGLMLALPGTPAVYYGDEIGMGDNIYLRDRQGVRTPMQWSAGANAGFSEANPQRLFLPPVSDPEYSYASVNVAAQDANPRSLLWWMRRMFAQRRRLAALAHGPLRIVPASSRKVLAFVREAGEERVLVVANLSRHAQPACLDLSEWSGLAPVEISGRTVFPTVDGGREYPLTLGGHAFYWFSLEREPAQTGRQRPVPDRAVAGSPALPRLAVEGAWDSVLRGPGSETLAAVLPAFLASRRWFAGKARQIRVAAVLDAAAVPLPDGDAWIALVGVSYTEGEDETYALPIAFASGERAGFVRAARATSLIAELDAGGVPGLLYGAEGDPQLARALLDAIVHERRFAGAAGEVVAASTSALASRVTAAQGREPSLLSAEQSNTSIRFGDAFVMKLFRKVEPGINPDLEVGLFLTERAAFPHTPPVCGSLQYRPQRGEPIALAILQGFVANEGDAWGFTLDAVGLYFESLVRRPEWRRPPPALRGMLEEARSPASDAARALVGPYLEAAGLLGRRTAQMHRALASDGEDPAFAPEPFSPLDRRALYQSQRNLTDDSFDLLRRRLPDLPESARSRAQDLVDRQDAVLDRFRRLLDRKTTALRTRTHGDYHLGQVLWTGSDFVIIDFEGEPARPAAIRRARRSPLRDVAGMLRSYHYAAFQGRATFEAGGALPRGMADAADAWAALWHGWVSASFLRAYLEEARGAVFLPADDGELEDLLVVHVLEKAVYELAYELNNRPAWVGLPLQGIAALLKEKP